MESHLNKFPTDMGAINDEHGERVDQDILNFENRFCDNLVKRNKIEVSKLELFLGL